MRRGGKGKVPLDEFRVITEIGRVVDFVLE